VTVSAVVAICSRKLAITDYTAAVARSARKGRWKRTESLRIFMLSGAKHPYGT